MNINFGKLLTILFLIIFFISGVLLTYALLTHELYWFAGLVTLVLGLSAIIFFHRDAFPLRFMYPGLLTFLCFMLLPMFFTIYIGFTNLSTGHFLSFGEIKKILLSETFVPDSESQNSYPFFLMKLDEAKTKFKVKVLLSKEGEDTPTLLSGEFDLNTKVKNVTLTPVTDPNDGIFNTLPPKDIIPLSDQLKEIKFILPNGKELSYYRTGELQVLKKRYSITEDNLLIDQESNITYKANFETGYFENGSDRIAPGFFVNIGTKNFINIFTNQSITSSFMKVIRWTLTWSFMTVLLTFSLGLFLALIINDKGLQLKAIYRVLLIIPYSIPFFISVLIFKGMLNKDFGVINEFVAMLGVAKIPWLDDPFWAKVSCLMVNLWLGFPYMFLLTTGILQSIPASIYEAAELDGAGRYAKLRFITLPMIFSAIAPLLIGSFAFNLNNFVGIYLLTAGGPPIPGSSTPAGETDILISYTYRLAFEGGAGQDFGLASSIAIFIFLIIAILTLINFRVFGMMKEEARR